MFKDLKILRSRRVLALAGAAVVAAPLFAYPLIDSPAALAQSQDSATASDTRPVVGQSESFADIVAHDRPAVVTITTRMEQDVASGAPQFGPGSPFDEFFRQFFGENGIPVPPPGHRHGRVAEALGSGFIVSPDGTIVTNNHVVDGATKIKVTLDDGTEYPAKLVGRDSKTDLAVVKIDPDKKLPVLEWGDSDTLRAGDQVLAIGNPFGVGTTVTSGIVSARGRDLQNGPYDFIQVDAAINHGNSGGPLVDTTGKVVGINTAIYSPNGGNVGVGFAIPSDLAKNIVAKLIENGSVEHGYLGVAIQPVGKDVAEALGLDEAKGALVASVQDDTPAASAGIEAGDVITAFGGKEVDTPRDLSRMVSDVTPGTDTTLTVWRKGTEKQVAVTIGQNDQEDRTASNDNDQQQDENGSGLNLSGLGLGLGDITDQMRSAYNIPDDVQGAIVENVDPDKPAGEHGLQEGDIITSVNQKETASAADVKKAVDEAQKAGRKSVLLQVERGDSQSFVAIPFDNA